MNNKIQSPEPKNVLVIDLDEYEKELDQQNAKSMQRAKLGTNKTRHSKYDEYDSLIRIICYYKLISVLLKKN